MGLNKVCENWDKKWSGVNALAMLVNVNNAFVGYGNDLESRKIPCYRKGY